MQIKAQQLKPLEGVELSENETKIIKWIRSTNWEAQKNEREPIPYKTKVPQFYGGVSLYNMQAGMGGGNLGALEIFIKKLQYQGVITKQESYPLTGTGGARFLSLKKADLDNLGVGKPVQEDDE